MAADSTPACARVRADRHRRSAVSEVRHVGSHDGLRRLDADALPKAPPGDAQSDDESDENGSRYAHDRAPFLLPPYEPTFETTRCVVRFVADQECRGGQVDAVIAKAADHLFTSFCRGGQNREPVACPFG